MHVVLDYVFTHKGIKTSDIILDLDFDPEIVIDVLDALEEKGLVEGKKKKKN
jgi:DNA-binding MarR family transcriptional regulator